MTSMRLDLTDPNWDDAAVAAVTDLGAGIARMVCVARALVQHGRSIDLAGLDHGVGLFCAKALDLPYEQGRAVRPHLLALLEEVDRLAAVITQAAHGSSAP